MSTQLPFQDDTGCYTHPYEAEEEAHYEAQKEAEYVRKADALRTLIAEKGLERALVEYIDNSYTF